VREQILRLLHVLENNRSAVEPLDDVRWWALRRAQSLKPSTYTCPLCGKLLHAMSEHALIAPEGDSERRRHAHTECVTAALRAGTLRTYDEWRRSR
jgi:hypothetical protein